MIRDHFDLFLQSNKKKVIKELNVDKVFMTDVISNYVNLNKRYQALIKNNKSHCSYPSLARELQDAKLLLIGLKKRRETLLAVANYIIEKQIAFLEQGFKFMKPMNLQEVADALNLHESTISRVTTGKYIVTPKGMFELKFFFASRLSTESGEACSDTAIKSLIQDIINNEKISKVSNSDSSIVSLLKEKGITVARRTVAKYRDVLKIPPSYQRNYELV